jgi:uncharacterized membrane protein (UPF0127 family)
VITAARRLGWLLALAGCGAGDRVGVTVAGAPGPARFGVCAGTAVTAAERRLGLLGRAALDPGEGLLLRFPLEGDVCITGAGMRFGIDAVFATGDGAVVAVERFGVDDERVLCHGPVREVLEVAAGVAAEAGPGDALAVTAGCDDLP